MITVRQVLNILESRAPLNLAESWDNVGLLIGSYEAPVDKIFLCLDVNDLVIDQAISCGANLIISHHPLYTKTLTRLTEDDHLGRIAWRLASNKISYIAMHTNLDSAVDGVNDTLIKKLNLPKIVSKTPIWPNKDTPELGLGAFLKFKEAMPIEALQKAVSTAFPGSSYVEPFYNAPKLVNTFAICSGGGFVLADDIYGKADVFMTGDITYHKAQTAQNKGLALIIAHHYDTEVIILDNLEKWLAETKLPIVHVDKDHRLRITNALE